MWWKAILGGAVVLFVIREIFKDLFHPVRSGALSDWIGQRLFRALRYWPALLTSAGPMAVVLVIVIWAMLLVTGFAFIYWAVFPAAFQLRTVNQPTPADGFWWCFYYSLEMLTTLGLGDIQPNPNWLRILSACHTLLGFSLVTASLTWVLLLFPALRRTRTLARKVTTLQEAEQDTGTAVINLDMHLVLLDLAEEVITAGVDLVHFPILFYFYAEDLKFSLAHALLVIQRFATDGIQPERQQRIRLSAAALHRALGDLTVILAGRLDVRNEMPTQVLSSFIQLHTPVDRKGPRPHVPS